MRTVLLSYLVAASVLALPGVANAATITVTTTDDDSDAICTLRDAIWAANFDIPFHGCAAGSGDDIINITATGTIDLASPLPALTSNITINGPGAGQLDVHRQSGGAYRIFSIQAGRTVSISDLTVSNGFLDTIGLAGAGIANSGTLTLEDVVVTGNQVAYTSDSLNPAAQAGGILNGGIMTIRRSTVSGNSVTSSQTADSGATSADALGGGIQNNGTLTIERSTVSGNSVFATVSSADGAAIAEGGGLYNWTADTATIRLSTFSGNQAEATAPSPGFATTRGGGVANFFGTLNATSNTIAFNTGHSSANLWSQGTETVANTIIANPVGGPNCQDTVTTDGGTNLVFPGSCDGLAGALSADPLLQPLANNGGPTQTHTLGWPSAALDAGSSQGDPTDQRELPRIVDIPTISDADDGADIGAVEMALDTTPPVDPTLDSASHDVNVGSKDPTIDIIWIGASDVGFGVDGYSFQWSTSSTTVPDQTKDAEESATGTTSPPLPDGNSHWFHLRTGDNAGNWTSTVHLGPFVIDANAPETTFAKVPKKRIKIGRARVRVRFAFTATEPGSTFECALDTRPWRACSSPWKVKVRAGRHRFSVRARDSLLNTDSTPAVRRFRVIQTG